MKKHFLLILILFNSCIDLTSSEWTKADMVQLIHKKTDLSLPDRFKVLLDLATHTEGAFDSDYSYQLTIEYDKLVEQEIINQIIESPLFDITNATNYNDPIWELIQTKTQKGIWSHQENGFKFLHCNNAINRPEPFYLTVDRITNKISLNLTHL